MALLGNNTPYDCAMGEVRRLRDDLAAYWAEIERLRAINAELKQAVDLMMNEIIASGNWNARDFGWPKAVAAAKAVQRHFVDEQKVASDD